MSTINFDKTPSIMEERAGQVAIGRSITTLPASTVTNNEIECAPIISKKYRIPIKFPNEIVGIRENWTEARLMNIERNKKLSLNEVSDIRDRVMKGKAHSEAKLFMYIPSFEKSSKISKEMARYLVNIQLDAGLDIINIPDSSSLISFHNENRKFLNELTELIREQDKWPSFMIDMKNEASTFRDKLQFAAEYAAGVTAIYRNPQKYESNFKTLARYHTDYRIMTILVNVDRFLANDRCSAAFPYGYLMADVVFPRYIIGISEKTQQLSLDSYDSVSIHLQEIEKKTPLSRPIAWSQNSRSRLLDMRQFGYLTLAGHRAEYGDDLDCVCPVDDGNTLSDLEFSYDRELNLPFRVHEAYSRYQITEIIRTKISNGGLMDYLFAKKYSPWVLEYLLNIPYPKQARLEDGRHGFTLGERI